MAILFSYENTPFKLREVLRVKRWIKEIIQSHGKVVGDISYVFCDDDYLLEINQTYLNHDTYTDIITFDYVEGNVISGDILISVERVRENSVIFETSFEAELHRVIIHGILHLLGQGDKTDAEASVMRKREEAALDLWSSIV